MPGGKRARAADDSGDESTSSAANNNKRLKDAGPLLDNLAVKMKPLKKKKWKPDESVDGALRLDGAKLRFAYALGDKEPLEVSREHIVDCKSAKGTTLVQVFLADAKPLVFDMLAKEAALTMRDSLRKRSAEELAAEAEVRRQREAAAQRKREAAAQRQRTEDERKCYLEAHPDVKERFDELVPSNRLTQEDFWSEDALSRTRFVRALDALEPEKEPPLAGEDNVIRITYERKVLPRLLACQPALNAAHRQLVVEGSMNERVFWQQYMCVRHALEPADLPGISRTANSEDERRKKEAANLSATKLIREAVSIDSRNRLEEEELELTSDARDGMELLVGGASRGSAGARFRKGYGLLGENAEAFFSGKAMQSSGRQHAPDILRQLNMAGDHIVMHQILGESTLRHLPATAAAGQGQEQLVDSGTARLIELVAGRRSGGVAEKQAMQEQDQLSALDIFDAEYCYARRTRSAPRAGVPGGAAVAGSPRSLSAAAPSAAATALTLTLSGGGGWRPDPKRRVSDHQGPGTPRATVFDAPTRSGTNAWSNSSLITSSPAGSMASSKDWEAASNGTNGGGTKEALAFKDGLRKYARTADTLLAHFWRAIGERDEPKVQRLGAHGSHGSGSLERLFDEVQTKFSDNAADKSLVPLYRKSLYITLNHAFEAFDSFKQQQEQEQGQQ